MSSDQLSINTKSKSDKMAATKKVAKKSSTKKGKTKPRTQSRTLVVKKGDLLDVSDSFRLADLYFASKNVMYRHQYSSYDQFLDELIPLRLKKGNNTFMEKVTKDKVFRYSFKFKNIAIKPATIENRDAIMFPHHARINDLTYTVKVVATVTQIQEVTDIATGKVTVNTVGEPEENYPIAVIPLMVRSKYCSLSLKKNSKEVSQECKYDPGAYFIVKGSEKVVMTLERMVENKPLVFLKKDSGALIYTVQVNSKSYDTDNMQIVAVRMKEKDKAMNIRVPILKEIPVCILFRALGVESDKDIINMCVYDSNDTDMINLLRVSLDNSVKENTTIKIRTQEAALEYLSDKLRVMKKYSETNKDVKQKEKQMHLEYLLANNFLYNVENKPKMKAYYLGYMINKLLQVRLGRMAPDDRDGYQNKRMDTVGTIMYEHYNQLANKQLNECNKFFKKKNTDDENPINVINQYKYSIVEQGFSTAMLKGQWGKKVGVSQKLERKSFLHMLSSLRRVVSLTGDASHNKLTGPRQLHNTSVGFMCYIETPEGPKVGLQKSLNLITDITIMMRSQIRIIKSFLKDRLILLEDIKDGDLLNHTRVFLNGEWLGLSKEPHNLYTDLRDMKKSGRFHPRTGIIHETKSDVESKEIRIYCDGGRLSRPLFRVKNNKVLCTKKELDMININGPKSNTTASTWEEFMIKNPDALEYIDMDESANSMIANFPVDVEKMRFRMNESAKLITQIKVPSHNKIVNRYDDFSYVRYTHCEIHPALLVGVVVANIPFSNHNAAVRNIFQFSQAKSAMGIYASNYKHRLDIGYMLYNLQRPLITTRMMDYVNTTDLPAGENCIVAIACYTGNNQEDSVIMNQSAIDRGLFRASYFKNMQATVNKNQSTSQDDIFAKPDRDKVVGMSNGSYDKLNDEGFAPEETVVENGDIIIGKVSPIPPTGNNNKSFKDNSEVFKGVVPGTIDKVYSNIYNSDGYEMKKVRLRSERVPIIGDKFCMVGATEVLTSVGWVQITKITKEHKVASLVDGKYIKYVNPDDVYDFNYKGKMYKLTSQQVDLDVTMDHDLYVKKRDRDEFERVPARDVIGKHVRFKKDCVNDNPEQKEMKIEYEGETHVYDMGEFVHEMMHFIRDEDVEITDKVLHGYLKSLKVDGRRMPEVVWDLSQYYSREVLDHLMLYNLSDCDLATFGETRLGTYDKQYADDLVRLAVHSGLSGTVSIHENEDGLMYSVKINEYDNEPEINNEDNIYDEQVEEVYDYEGSVYCLQVPSHVFMSRLNGKNVWVGNCCYSDDHEVLTSKGWTRVNKLKKTHKVASLNNGVMEYAPILELQEYDYKGKMYVLETPQVSLKVTPNHRMYISGRDKASKYKIMKAEDLYGKRVKYLKSCDEFKQNVDLDNLPKMLQADEDGERIKYFVVHDKDGQVKHKFDLNDWLVILGVWLAEGSLNNKQTLNFAANKQRVKDALVKACANLDIKLGTYQDKKGDNENHSYRINSIDITRTFYDIHKTATNKYMPKWVWLLSRDHCKILMNSMILGDGHYMKGTTTIRYDTSSVKLCNDFQRLALHAGFSANHYLKYEAGHQSLMKSANGVAFDTPRVITSTADAWRLTLVSKQNRPLINKNKKADGTGQIDKWEDFDGKVYCCSVPGDGIIYVRRNGKPVWSGNSRSGQKGTIGTTLRNSDMPCTKDGIRPDIIMNPNAIPSRMTIGQLIECLTGKVAALEGNEIDGTPFNMADIESIKDRLEKLGYNREGYEYLYNGMTGKRMKVMIFIGPTYYQRLTHMVNHKIHSRARGPVTVMTRSPPEGRARDGGLRFGEMEQNAMVAHGAVKFLKERFMEAGDAHEFYICDDCGLFAQRMLKRDSKPYETRDDVYWCAGCKNRSRISRVRAPFAYKLLMQELMAMNVAPRIRVKKNRYGASFD